MKSKISARFLAAGAAGAATLLVTYSARASLVADYVAKNYNGTTWTDTSGNGNNATVLGTAPTLVTTGTGTTPNGSATILFAGTGGFSLATALSVGPYSIYAFLEPTSLTGNQAITSGNNAALEYRLNSGTPNTLASQTANYGSASTVLTTSSFSDIGVQVAGSASSSGISFFLNGTANGTASVTTAFSQPIQLLGQSEDFGQTFPSGNRTDFLNAYVAEIRIYSDTTTATPSGIDSAFKSAYVTATPEPGTVALAGVGAFGLLLRRRRTR